MLATDFTRRDCMVGKKRRTYGTLEREWRCGLCGSRLGEKWTDNDEDFPDNWHIECQVCGPQGTRPREGYVFDFIHEYEAARQKQQARRIDRIYGPIIDEYMKNKEKNDNQGTD